MECEQCHKWSNLGEQFDYQVVWRERAKHHISHIKYLCSWRCMRIFAQRNEMEQNRRENAQRKDERARSNEAWEEMKT